ncbi:MAG: hypothetical protein JWM56_78 [Candidatus Peribacteria bacterium]|nr:hypothetical protein [Candidatus Peribacteria bacterium]
MTQENSTFCTFVSITLSGKIVIGPETISRTYVNKFVVRLKIQSRQRWRTAESSRTHSHNPIFSSPMDHPFSALDTELDTEAAYATSKSLKSASDNDADLQPDNFSLPSTDKHTPLLVSIVVPVFNERETLPLLLSRLQRTMAHTNYHVEIIIVDDHSNDGTREFLQNHTNTNSVHVLRKRGKRGKSYSLIEGFRRAKGDVIAMIDGDLQYPPEAIPAMVRTLQKVDIVVAKRMRFKTSRLRNTLSYLFRLVFGRILLGLNVDVQSGLKVFRKEILDTVELKTSAWGFDYQFLYKARRMGYTVGEKEIIFEERKFGHSHVKTISTALELAWGALRLRLSYIPRDLFAFLYYPHASEHEVKNEHNTTDYLFLPDIQSSKKHIYKETVSLAVVSLLIMSAIIGALSYVLRSSPLVILSGILSVVYLGLIGFKLYVVHQSLNRKLLSFSRRDVAAIKDEDLPLYTILIPLYKEAEVIPQIVKAMTSIDYPTDKLEILITVEEYDHETIDAIRQANMPPHFRMLTLPDVQPKSKPKALNVAFSHTHGEFFVIYDAEIIPDADQLKKAYLAFRKDRSLACVQTRLDHYNLNQNWITKLFNAEFSFYYDLFLPGLQKLGYPLPLSGHSTHFRRQVLADIGLWDPYNMTEDCDVGIRLARKGYKTEILDSLSQEEATCTFDSWVKQRSRWMKGFIQTAIVHLRHPVRFKNELGSWKNFGAFLLIVPGSVVMNVLNLFYWGLLVLWFTTHSPVIQLLFPRFILYFSLLSFVLGNFMFTYLNLIGSYKRKRFSMVKYSLLSFVYWLMLAYAGIRATIQLFTSPHRWEKTTHGTHLLPNSLYAVPVS